MWIRQVTAQAFGPFKGDALHLARGLTVVVGRNEAGKSSWHAATYAALCGMRRGKGRRTRDDELFAARHAPWDGGPWEVSAVVALADGRTVELHHDLSGQIASSARDLDLGHDVTAEIIYDGAPDGSVWLGLDRRAFSAVACVRQAEILAVTRHAEAIQEHLQRAAATAGADETAATALAALAHHQREHVGLDRANSTKPLRVAIDRVRVAGQRHQAATAAHADWLRREAEVAQLERRASGAAHQLRLAKAARAGQAADQLAQRVEAMTELARLHPQPPPALATDDDLAARVATAVHAWVQRPTVEPLDGPSADELQRRLEEVPPMPSGDLDPHPSVVAARRALSDLVTRFEAHHEHTPPQVEAPAAGASTSAELVELARQLSTPLAEVDPSLPAEVERLRSQVEHRAAPAGRRRALVAAAVATAVLVAAAVGLVVVGQPVSAAVAVALAAGAGAVATKQASPSRRPVDDGMAAELRSARARLAEAEEAVAAAGRRRSVVLDRVRQLGLDPDPAMLGGLALQIERAEQSAVDHQRWQEALRPIEEQLRAAALSLVEALAARTVSVGGDGDDPVALLVAVDQYEHACRQRRRVAEAARARPGIETELRARRQAEARAAADAGRVAEARAALVAVGAELGVVDPSHGPDLSEVVERLHEWERQRARRRAQRERAQRAWLQLQGLLDGRTLDDWKAEAARLRDAAEQLGRGLEPDELDAVDLGARPEEVVRGLDAAAVEDRLALAEARRELAVRAESLDPVAEAAEELAAAEAELARVRRLELTLVTTQQFMAAAQQRVHRDLAPVLAERVRHRLAAVTDGRYDDVIVDPESLTVHVRDRQGRLRDAGHLSQGTAEQVFLLLRVAMAEILTTDSCPLLLDDVTVQSDPVRTRAVLDVLHQVSADHQVVLFSQEDDVAAWARTHLGDRDSLVALDPVE